MTTTALREQIARIVDFFDDPEVIAAEILALFQTAIREAVLTEFRSLHQQSGSGNLTRDSKSLPDYLIEDRIKELEASDV